MGVTFLLYLGDSILEQMSWFPSSYSLNNSLAQKKFSLQKEKNSIKLSTKQKIKVLY